MQLTQSPSRVGLWFATLALIALGACATGSNGTGDDDQPVDANRIDGPQTIDAPRPIDAPQPIDARIDASSLVDAPIVMPDGGGIFCATSAECGTGMCCFPPGGSGICLPGAEILGVCIPGA